MRVKLIFTFIVLTAYANLGQAQTKEETIAWIKERFEDYKSKHYPNDNIKKNIHISPCYIRVQYVGENFFIDFSFNPSDAKWIVDEDRLRAEESIVDYKYADAYNIDEDVYSSIHDFNEEKDANLDKLMAKALNHLGTFCNEKKSKKDKSRRFKF